MSKKEAVVEPKVEKASKAAKVEKTPKEPKKPKIKLVIAAPKGVSVKETKFLSVATSDANKKKRAWLRGSMLGLTEVISNKVLKAVSEDDATKKHLGKTRMMGKVTQEELNEIITKFFA